jgi:hypothetical protein
VKQRIHPRSMIELSLRTLIETAHRESLAIWEIQITS